MTLSHNFHGELCTGTRFFVSYMTADERASSIVSRMAFGFPGKFNMSALPRKPDVCLDSTAVGTTLRHHSTRSV